MCVCVCVCVCVRVCVCVCVCVWPTHTNTLSLSLSLSLSLLTPISLLSFFSWRERILWVRSVVGCRGEGRRYGIDASLSTLSFFIHNDAVTPIGKGFSTLHEFTMLICTDAAVVAQKFEGFNKSSCDSLTRLVQGYLTTQESSRSSSPSSVFSNGEIKRLFTELGLQTRLWFQNSLTCGLSLALSSP